MVSDRGLDTRAGRAVTLTPNGIFSELVKLREESGGNLHLRLTLARTLLEGDGWMVPLRVTTLSSGIAALEEECFGDICGAMTLPQMLEVLKEVPAENDWKVAKYNLRKLHGQMMARRPKKPTIEAVKERHPPLRESFSLAAFEELRQENKELRKQLKDLTAKNRKLQRVVRRVVADMQVLQDVSELQEV